MTLKTYPFDASRYLDDAESHAELLKDALETGDTAYMAHAIGVVAGALGMTSLATEAGVSREALYDALNEEGHLESSSLLRLIEALGVKIAATQSPEIAPRLAG